jgi:hypothetical protein
VLVGKPAALSDRFANIVADVARGLDRGMRDRANPDRNRNAKG